VRKPERIGGMNTWLIFLISYVLLGLVCYVCMLCFFPPNDARRESDDSLEKPSEQAAQEAAKYPLSSIVIAILAVFPGLLITFAFAPFLLGLAVWVRVRHKD